MKKKAPRELKSVAEVLAGLLNNRKSALSDQFLRWKVWQRWPEIVGKTLAEHSEPIAYQRGRLYIWVKSSARLQEIRFFENQIKERVNIYLNMKWLDNIRFTLDRRGIPEDLRINFPEEPSGGTSSEPSP